MSFKVLSNSSHSMILTKSKIQLSRHADGLNGHPPPSNTIGSEARATQSVGESPNPASTQLPAELWSWRSPVPEGFALTFSAATFHTTPHHTSPAAPPTQLLDLRCATNCSKLSFPRCTLSIRQHFNKAIHCKPNVLGRCYWEKNHKEAGKGRRGRDTNCGPAYMP